MITTEKQLEMTGFEALEVTDLAEITGGIAPILIGVGIAASISGGFAGGYALSRVFG